MERNQLKLENDWLETNLKNSCDNPDSVRESLNKQNQNAISENQITMKCLEDQIESLKTQLQNEVATKAALLAKSCENRSVPKLEEDIMKLAKANLEEQEKNRILENQLLNLQDR